LTEDREDWRVSLAEDGTPLPDWDLPWMGLNDYLNLHPVPQQRIATGLPALDVALGGGIPVGQLVTLQGAPHAGKTSLATQIAMRAARGSAADVYFCSPDEGARGACTRAAQGFGLSRDKIAAGDEDTMVAFGVALAATRARIRTLDPDLDAVVLGRVLDSIKRRQYGEERPTIIVLDSTQSLRLEAEFEAERLRIGGAMKLMRKHTRAWDCIIINISHISRGAYKHKKQEDNINPLAGGAESADIERQSDIMVHLDGDIRAVVSAQTIKNRAGRGEKPSWQMRFDPDTATFVELDYAEAQDEASRVTEQARQRDLERTRDEVVRLVARKGGWVSQTYVAGRVGKRKAVVVEALEMGVRVGDLEVTEGPRGSVLYRETAPH
jgi:KaiC/GvpD/RAD55 family RecA-like ATPase